MSQSSYWAFHKLSFALSIPRLIYLIAYSRVSIEIQFNLCFWESLHFVFGSHMKGLNTVSSVPQILWTRRTRANFFMVTIIISYVYFLLLLLLLLWLFLSVLLWLLLLLLLWLLLLLLLLFLFCIVMSSLFVGNISCFTISTLLLDLNHINPLPPWALCNFLSWKFHDIKYACFRDDIHKKNKFV